MAQYLRLIYRVHPVEQCESASTESNRRNTMGIVIPFPFEKLSRNQHTEARRHQSASVIILPVIRIERAGNSQKLQEAAAVPKSRKLRRPQRHRTDAFGLFAQVSRADELNE